MAERAHRDGAEGLTGLLFRVAATAAAPRGGPGHAAVPRSCLSEGGSRSWAWWLTEHRRARLGGHKFEASLGHLVRTCIIN